jgi:hydroxymethylpyrimidine pyrophosphatase-like HAD family hydrolase
MKTPRPKTIICDIDGTLITHTTTPFDLFNKDITQTLLPGVKEKFDEWDSRCYKIILLTGRKESMRAQTVQQLKEFGIYYDQLVMGVGGGARVLINDLKPNKADPNNPTAIAVNVDRNEGLENIDV